MMRSFDKKKYAGWLALLLAFTMIIPGPASVFAEEFEYQEREESDDDDDNSQEMSEKKKEIEESREKLKNAQAGRANIQATIASLKTQMANLEQEKDKLSAVVTELDGQLLDVQDKIAQLEMIIAQKELEIHQLTDQLHDAEEVEKEQYELMKQRIQFMYERGPTTYMSLLLGAESMTDMLNKAEYIEEIYDYDRRMLEQYKEIKENIAELKQTLETERVNLDNAQEEATAKESEMSALIVQKEKQIENYESDINNKEEAIANYEAEIAAQNATISSIESSILKAEREYNDMSLSSNTVGRRKYNGGKFAWPAPSYTRISDDYGNRIHPTLGVQQFHNGVDMAAPSGSPILAAADGTVVGAGYSGTMGNYIMINHGSGIFTIYMHASSIYVTTGKNVSKGQQIGAVGSTGRSTGPHLHFSVRVNGSYVSPWDYL